MAGFEQTTARVPETTQQQETNYPVDNGAREADREYDRRGVLMPRRAKVGGIITPQ